MDEVSWKFVIIGGGIAGVTCAETIQAYLPHCHITIVSASPLVKAVRNLHEFTRTLSSFDVEETLIDEYMRQNPNISIHRGAASKIDYKNKQIFTEDGSLYPYDKLCVCTGAYPKVIFPDNKYVLGIRDTITAKELDLKLQNAERIVVVGNGGIATELVFQVCNCNIVWAIKDKAIGQVFFDIGAAEFFLPFLKRKSECKTELDQKPKTTIKRMNYELESSSFSPTSVSGNALGPDWHQSLNLEGSLKESNDINIEYDCEVKELHYVRIRGADNIEQKCNGTDWPLFVELTNGKIIGCDFLISATGVLPNINIFHDLPCTIGEDGGVEVDENMRVRGVPDVYAAGDVCSTNTWERAAHWLQMRLWTQARQMGAFAAQCMVTHQKILLQTQTISEKIEDVPLDICFSLFAHVTKFFSKKICLLGRYNAQDLDKDSIELLLRTTPKEEYIKVILKNGRMQGAVLIGDTDLEETFENLILNETDLSFLGENLLDPNVDIADYFD